MEYGATATLSRAHNGLVTEEAVEIRVLSRQGKSIREVNEWG